MNVVLWVLQILLALVFLGAGVMKLMRTRDQLRSSGMAYVEDFSDTTMKLIGAAEVLGALGLVLPAATGVAPILTPVAAAALAVVMVGAVVTHVRRKEYPKDVVLPAALLVMSVIVAWGRFGPYAF